MGLPEGTEEFFPKHRDIQFSGDGGMLQCESIILQEPGLNHQKAYFKLLQMIRKAQSESELAILAVFGGSSAMEKSMKLAELRDGDASGEDAKPLHKIKAEKYAADSAKMAEDVRQSLEQSQKVDLYEFISIFSAMVSKKADRRIALISGEGYERVMEGGDWQKLHQLDQLDMAVRWCCFFVIPSETGETTKPNSDKKLGSQQESVVKEI